MPVGSRNLFRAASRLTTGLSKRSISSFNKTPPAANEGVDVEQAQPIGAFYEAIMHQPLPEMKPEEPPQSSPKAPRSSAAAKKSAAAQGSYGRQDTVKTSASPPPTPSAEPATAEQKARIIFGSRLAGPAERKERLQSIKDRSQMIAGILVPPKPDEPDNCCMGGCVNCVWDRFGDEMEEWVAAKAEADKRLHTHPAGKSPKPSIASTIEQVATSMDDDGGGSETAWPSDQLKDLGKPKIAKDFWDEDLYKNVPVGIREFMKTEKKLKQRHEKEGTVGG